VMVGIVQDSAHNRSGFVRGPGIPFTQISNGAGTGLLKINDSNVAVGNSDSGAFMVTVPGGAITPIAPPPGFTNPFGVTGISNQGLLVGEASTTSTILPSKGFEQGAGVPFTLFSLGNSPTSVFPATDHVHPNAIALTAPFPNTLIVGFIVQGAAVAQAFLSQGGTQTPIAAIRKFRAT
jgi:hypothetical protein